MTSCEIYEYNRYVWDRYLAIFKLEGEKLQKALEVRSAVDKALESHFKIREEQSRAGNNNERTC